MVLTNGLLVCINSTSKVAEIQFGMISNPIVGLMNMESTYSLVLNLTCMQVSCKGAIMKFQV